MAWGATPSPTSWEILGVDPSASMAEVKTQFRALVRMTHPDHGGSAALFNMVKAAYEDVRSSKATSPVSRPEPYFARAYAV